MIDFGRRSFLKASSASIMMLGTKKAMADGIFPSRTVEIVSTFPPGGGTDVIGRYLAQKLSPKLKQPVIVLNKPGAGGTIGWEFIARAVPDGYTLAIGTPSYAVNATYYKLNFNPVQDISPISQITSGPLLILVNPSLPIHSVKDLIAYAKANPGKLNFASSGTGSVLQLAAEYFKMMTGTDIVHVPYRGVQPALLDLEAGAVQLMWCDVLVGLPPVKSGSLKAIAVTTLDRLPTLPNIPTVAESGLPGYEIEEWYALWGPAKLPADAVSYMNTELRQVLATDETAAFLARQGLSPAPTTPEKCRELIRDDIAKYAKIMKAAHMSGPG